MPEGFGGRRQSATAEGQSCCEEFARVRRDTLTEVAKHQVGVVPLYLYGRWALVAGGDLADSASFIGWCPWCGTRLQQPSPIFPFY